MNFTDSSITDIIQMVFALIGGMYALFLLRQSNKEKRNQLMVDIYNGFYGDEEIRRILYAVDTGQGVNEIRFQGKLEREADKTLRFLDFVGHLIRQKSITKSSVAPFQYEIGRILKNQKVKEYIIWLETIGVNLENLQYCPDGRMKVKLK